MKKAIARQSILCASGSSRLVRVRVRVKVRVRVRVRAVSYTHLTLPTTAIV